MHGGLQSSREVRLSRFSSAELRLHADGALPGVQLAEQHRPASQLLSKQILVRGLGCTPSLALKLTHNTVSEYSIQYKERDICQPVGEHVSPPEVTFDSDADGGCISGHCQLSQQMDLMRSVTGWHT